MSDTRRDPGFPPSPSGPPARPERSALAASRRAGSGETSGTRDSGFGASHGRRPTPGELDAAIDGVARKMTDAEPSVGLRASVLDAIERGGRLRAPAVPRWAWAGAAAGLLLAVATATWLARPAQVLPAGGSALDERRAASPVQPGPVHVQTTASAGGATGPTTAEAHNLGAARTPAVILAAARSGRGRRDGQFEPAAAREAVALLPALPDIQPLILSDVEPAALDIAGVELVPFEVAPMGDIPALDTRSTDNRPFAGNLEERR